MEGDSTGTWSNVIWKCVLGRLRFRGFCWIEESLFDVEFDLGDEGEYNFLRNAHPDTPKAIPRHTSNML